MTIELATSLIFLISSVYGPASADDLVLQSNLKDSLKAKQEIVRNPETLEDHVKDYFKDDPILAEIARCESTYRQYGKSGGVIRGKVNSKDVGLMQINEIYHIDRAEKLGFDIYTLEGNMAYAKWLYDKEGVKPWMSSSKCWKNATGDKVAIGSEKDIKNN